MKKLAAIAWKEWHEVRVFLWIGIGVFLVLPFIAGLENSFQYSRRLQIWTSPWILPFGGVLTVFIAVSTTCRDLRGRVEDFWRSRPVGMPGWVVVKYLMGLSVAMVACALPMVVEYYINTDKDAVLSASAFLFTLPAFYSLGFLAGCLVRRPVHAAMLALAGVLLIYFLPVVLPPLHFVSTTDVYSDGIFSIPSGLFEIGAGMLLVPLVATALALIAVPRQWRIESGRKMIFAAVALTILILFGSAAFQLGTDMPILRQVAMPARETALYIRFDGNRGFVLGLRSREDGTGEPVYRTLALTSDGIELGPAKKTVMDWLWPDNVSPKDHPEIRYHADTGSDRDGNDHCWLQIAELDRNVLTRQRIWTLPSLGIDTECFCYACKDRLYIFGRRLVTLDISEPRIPRIISDEPLPLHYAIPAYGWWGLYQLYPLGKGLQTTAEIVLPPIPALPARQRLEAVLGISQYQGWANCFDGETLCVSARNGIGSNLMAFRLTKLTDEKATFELIGLYRPTILETAFGISDYFGLHIQNGLLYASGGGEWVGTQEGMGIGALINPHVSVFDLRSNPPFKLVGHFAAPGAEEACPLPDGNALVGGSKIWLVGPPPGRRGN